MITYIYNNISNNYSEGNGIHIDDEHNISVKPEEFIDNHSIYLNSYGQLVVNNEVVLEMLLMFLQPQISNIFL